MARSGEARLDLLGRTPRLPTGGPRKCLRGTRSCSRRGGGSRRGDGSRHGGAGRSGSLMELRHLRYFVAIAEEGSFTRAAERLWVAQPGLSTQIRRLETELGVQLFDRHTRGVDLTVAGELLLERARVALAAAEAAAATGRHIRNG